MRTRPAWLLYLLVLLSGGLFSFVWLVLMLRDADPACTNANRLQMSFVVIINNKTRYASGLAPSVTEAIVMLVLTILVFLSLPILQRRLNKIAKARQQPIE